MKAILWHLMEKEDVKIEIGDNLTYLGADSASGKKRDYKGAIWSNKRKKKQNAPNLPFQELPLIALFLQIPGKLHKGPL